MKTKVLLDTDIGTDIDDAVCLAYLLARTDCELLGITTVTGEVEKRAMLASAICTVAGKDIPIFPGADRPIIGEQKQPVAQQASELYKWPHQTKFPKGEAIEFLRSTIRKYPGEVILLTVAPLTNIGLLFSVDPEIPSLLKGIVLMCGRFSDNVSGKYSAVEWNAMGDPIATSIVYNSDVALHRSCGLDVTSWVWMSAEDFRKTFQSVKLFAPILDFAEVWFKDWNGTVYHDPLAAATIFDPSICTFERGNVAIDISDETTRGKTIFQPDNNGQHEVGVKVDQARFFKHYLSVIGAM